jgi:hypothetical protein
MRVQNFRSFGILSRLFTTKNFGGKAPVGRYGRRFMPSADRAAFLSRTAPPSVVSPRGKLPSFLIHLEEVDKAESKNYAGKMVIDDARMWRVREEVSSNKNLRSTPDGDLRFIEGLLDIPYGHIREFSCVPDAASQTCVCGRQPNAADVVAFAVRRNIHARQTIRDALLGLENIYEPSADGREAACLKCSHKIRMMIYFGQNYVYA